MIKILKPNENPFRSGSKKAIAWRIVRGYGGCTEDECVGALDQEGLGPQECFLMSLLDGESDVRSILWVAPLREVDLLRTLRQLLDRGVIEMRGVPASVSE